MTPLSLRPHMEAGRKRAHGDILIDQDSRVTPKRAKSQHPMDDTPTHRVVARVVPPRSPSSSLARCVQAFKMLHELDICAMTISWLLVPLLAAATHRPHYLGILIPRLKTRVDKEAECIYAQFNPPLTETSAVEMRQDSDDKRPSHSPRAESLWGRLVKRTHARLVEWTENTGQRLRWSHHGYIHGRQQDRVFSGSMMQEPDFLALQMWAKCRHMWYKGNFSECYMTENGWSRVARAEKHLTGL